MKYLSLIALVLLLAGVAASAGCIGTTIPATPTPTPTPMENPLTGDPIVGVWTTSEHLTQTDSETGKTIEITINYTITVQEDDRGIVAYDRKERKGTSVSFNSYSMDGTVDKSDNIYTIDAQLLGVYSITLSSDGSAVMVTRGGIELPLQKADGNPA